VISFWLTNYRCCGTIEIEFYLYDYFDKNRNIVQELHQKEKGIFEKYF
jgi:hypothetical protein